MAKPYQQTLTHCAHEDASVSYREASPVQTCSWWPIRGHGTLAPQSSMTRSVVIWCAQSAHCHLCMDVVHASKHLLNESKMPTFCQIERDDRPNTLKCCELAQRHIPRQRLVVACVILWRCTSTWSKRDLSQSSLDWTSRPTRRSLGNALSSVSYLLWSWQSLATPGYPALPHSHVNNGAQSLLRLRMNPANSRSRAVESRQ